MAPNDQGVPTFAMARGLLCKASDRSKCGEARARVAKQSRSVAEAPIVSRCNEFYLETLFQSLYLILMNIFIEFRKRNGIAISKMDIPNIVKAKAMY